MKVDVDLGATDIHRSVEVAILITDGSRPYRLTVFFDNSFAIDTKDDGSSFWYAVDTNTGIARHVIGYAFRRAICRGIDQCEISETKDLVEISLGDLRTGRRQ